MTGSFPSAGDLTRAVLSTFAPSTFFRPILDNSVVLLDVFVPFFPCSQIKSKIEKKTLLKMGYRILQKQRYFLQLGRVITGRRIKVSEQPSLELATKFYQTSDNHRRQSTRPKGYHSWKNDTSWLLVRFRIDKKSNTDEYPFAKLLLHFSPKYNNRYGRYLPEQICPLLLSGWLIHEGKATWDFENLH